VPQYQRSREAARRQRGIQQEWPIAERTPLILDTKTQAILDGADRVETFRLADEDEDESRASVPAPPAQYFENYPVRRVGPPQGKAFAEALSKALSQASSEPNGVQCYEPGIGFRVWKGAAHRDICICFHCAALEVLPKEAVCEIVRGRVRNRPAKPDPAKSQPLAD